MVNLILLSIFVFNVPTITTTAAGDKADIVWKQRKSWSSHPRRQSRRVRHTERAAAQSRVTLSLFKNDDNNKTNELPFDLGRVAKPGRWERRKTAFQAKKQNPALQAMRGRSRMTRQLRQGQNNQIDTLVDCAGVTCPSLASCFKKVYTPGACCPSCKHEGCKCAEGAELAACTQNGFKRGILPVGQGFKAHEGTTCTCYSAGDPILCVMTPDESDYGVMTERTPTYRANNRRNPQFPQRRDAVNNGGQSQDLYNNYGDYSAYSSQQQYSDDSAGQVATNQTQSRYNENYYGDYYAGYYGGYGPSLTQYNAYDGKANLNQPIANGQDSQDSYSSYDQEQEV